MNLIPRDLENLPAAVRDERIIALCDRAIVGLNEARDMEDVVSIRNATEAFALYTRKMKAAVEAQNQCELVVLLAEARIGAELKAAQERGEVAASAGRPKTSEARTISPPTHADIGIPRQRAAEMKNLAAAGENRIRDEVAKATREKRRPSKRNILNAIPVISERPPQCVQFSLWLRTGAALMPKLGTPGSFLRLMAEYRMHIPPAELEAVLTFLGCMQEMD